MSEADRVKVLFSHKCNEQAHRAGAHLRESLRSRGIDLEIDNLDVGQDVYTGMQTFRIEAVLFLCSPESLASRAVQLELDSAARQRIPVFTVLVDGELPASLKTRSSWRILSFDGCDYDTGIAKLADSILARILFNRQIRLLNPSNYWYDGKEAARAIAEEENRTLIAEAADELAERYRRLTDPQTHYWIAIALGRADTPRAAALVAQLPRGRHPLEEEGIRKAQEMLDYHQADFLNQQPRR